MARNTPNKKNLILVLSAVFILITVLTGVLAFFVKNNPYEDKDKPSSSEAEAMAPGEGEEESGDSQEELSDVQPAEPGDGEADGGLEPSDEPEAGEEDEGEAGGQETVFYNVPDEMRAVMLVAGRDYLTNEADAGRAAVAAQIDSAIAAAKELTMNSIIIDTKYQNDVLFSSPTLSQAKFDLDCTDYIITKAREEGLYVYATYDVTDGADGDGYVRLSNADGDTLDLVAEGAGAFAEKYKPDGILFQNYYNPPSASGYAQYLQNGGGIGYENYMRQVPRALLETAVAAVRKDAPGTQAGLLVDAVWQNQALDREGPETTADFTALRDGNADTRAFVLSGLYDFVVVNNSDSTVVTEKAPFRTVAQWWSDLASGTDLKLYTLHSNEKLGNVAGGWSVMEQLSKQLIDQEKIGGYSGSVFNSLKALRANPGNSTTILVQYMNNQIDEQYVLTQLALTKPAQLTFTTKEQAVTFQGASDPREPVTINGEKIDTNESGYFSVQKELKAGVNTFEISHKNKTFTYTITRQVEVLKEVWPTGSISVDGGMQVSVSALAYEGAKVTASIGGQNITLSETDTQDDDSDTNSGYQRYTGVFTAPSASATATSLGTITVSASAQGATKTMNGAAVTVNKIAKMGDGAIVQVVADQAETFPITTLNDNSNPGYFPLPKGTIDMSYGSEIIYKDGKKTYSYWKLQSGVRVYSKDIQATGSSLPNQNAISKMTVKSTAQFTAISLATRERVPYKTSYDGSKLTFAFEYTASAPESQTLKNNPLFTSANWSGSTLTLTLRKQGGFLGYKAYYEDGDLVLRFNNSPGSLSGARIVVDPGHGGSDPGNLGFYPGKDEADINLSVANKLAAELKSRGASVLMVTPGSTMASRLAAARAFNPQALVSVHSNSAPNASATGTEVYYFYPFQKQLAANVAANLATALGTTNRGAKQALYYMTRESQFPCVLAELGFMSNNDEYAKLISSKYQSKMAVAIANGLEAYLGGTGTGTGGSGKNDEDDGDEDDRDDGPSEGVKLNKSVLNLDEGDSAVLKATASGTVTWKSEDSSIATVNSAGKVVAKSEGITYIIASAKNGAYTAECEVNVGEVESGDDKVTGVSLNKKTLTLYEGDTYTLSATVRPSSAGNKGVKWESDDEDIAKVSSSGKVTAVSEGETWVTVTTKEGDYSVDCEIIVKEQDHSGGLVRKVEIEADSTSLKVGTRMELTAKVTPSNAQDTGVKWRSSDNEIALISNDDDDSCKVEGLKNGMVTITATAYDDGKAKGSIKIKVGTGVSSGSSNKEDDDDDDVEPEEGVEPESVSITGPSTIRRGMREEYTGKILPANCEDPGVDWEVSDDDILGLTTYSGEDENTCKVEGLRTGTAYLIGRSYMDKSVYYRFKITVKSS